MKLAGALLICLGLLFRLLNAASFGIIWALILTGIIIVLLGYLFKPRRSMK